MDILIFRKSKFFIRVFILISLADTDSDVRYIRQYMSVTFPIGTTFTDEFTRFIGIARYVTVRKRHNSQLIVCV